MAVDKDHVKFKETSSAGDADWLKLLLTLLVNWIDFPWFANVLKYNSYISVLEKKEGILDSQQNKKLVFLTEINS